MSVPMQKLITPCSNGTFESGRKQPYAIYSSAVLLFQVERYGCRLQGIPVVVCFIVADGTASQVCSLPVVIAFHGDFLDLIIPPVFHLALIFVIKDGAPHVIVAGTPTNEKLTTLN